jgi:hypothetical protein
MNLNGRFVEYQSAALMDFYNGETESLCTIRTLDDIPEIFKGFKELYGLDMNDGTKTEYICPRNYDTGVDTQSWGMCSCWENGGRRSQNNYTTKCVEKYYGLDEITKKYGWIDAPALSSNNQVCVYYVQQNNKNNSLEIKCVDKKVYDGCINGDMTLGPGAHCYDVNCEDATISATDKKTCCIDENNICPESFEDVGIDILPDGI